MSSNRKAPQKPKEKRKRHQTFSVIGRDRSALQEALRISQEAASVGFDWGTAVEVLQKLEEEYRELRAELAAPDQRAVAAEIGDLLFTIVNLARKLRIDAEDALHYANRKFLLRFLEMQKQALQAGRKLSDYSLVELEALWQAAKQQKHM